MNEKAYYPLIKDCLENLLKSQDRQFHLEITANKGFSPKLKAQIPRGRDIIFYFLGKSPPDITGFIKEQYATAFVVVEFKPRRLKLDDIYQTRKYADLFTAKHALLLTTQAIPEEIKRLQETFLPSLLLWDYRKLTLARFDQDTKSLCDWYRENPFET